MGREKSGKEKNVENRRVKKWRKGKMMKKNGNWKKEKEKNTWDIEKLKM